MKRRTFLQSLAGAVGLGGLAARKAESSPQPPPADQTTDGYATTSQLWDGVHCPIDELVGPMPQTVLQVRPMPGSVLRIWTLCQYGADCRKAGVHLRLCRQSPGDAMDWSPVMAIRADGNPHMIARKSTRWFFDPRPEDVILDTGLISRGWSWTHEFRRPIEVTYDRPVGLVIQAGPEERWTGHVSGCVSRPSPVAIDGRPVPGVESWAIDFG